MIQVNASVPQQYQILAAPETPASTAQPQAAATAAIPTPSAIVSISQQALSLQAATTDAVAPKVTKFSPADGAGNVSLSANINVTFSEAIKRGSGNIVLKKASGEVVETFNAAASSNISIRNKTLTINPTQNFELGTRYLVTFDAGTVTDLSGNSYAGSASYDFRSKPDKTAPRALNFNPRDGANGVSPSTNIVVTFSEAIKAGSGNIILKDAKGKVVQTFSAASALISGNTLTLDPAAKLATSSKYSVVFSPGSVKDLAGNAYKGTKTYDFTTASTDIPYVAPGGSSGGGSSNISYSDDPQDTNAFNIALSYTGDAAYLTYFQQARTIWESVITGDLAASGGIDDLRITASVTAIDGVNGVLGSAGPNSLRGVSNLPITGTMQFDSADMSNMISNGTLLKVVLHEMGHVLGIGSLWSMFNLNSTPGQYTGAQALAAYKTMAGGNAGATFVPLEDGGGGGTANVHWEEDIFGDELMTGYAENDSTMPLSILTIASLQDLGYTVNTGVAEAFTVPNSPALNAPEFAEQTIV